MFDDDVDKLREELMRLCSEAAPPAPRDHQASGLDTLDLVVAADRLDKMARAIKAFAKKWDMPLTGIPEPI